MAICTHFRLCLAYRMRKMRCESLRRKAGRADRRLLDVNALPVDVGGAQDERRTRPDGCYDITFGRLVAAELEHVVASDLGIVGREIAGLGAFILVAPGLPVRLDRQMR